MFWKKRKAAQQESLDTNAEILLEQFKEVQRLAEQSVEKSETLRMMAVTQADLRKISNTGSMQGIKMPARTSIPPPEATTEKMTLAKEPPKREESRPRLAVKAG